MDFLNKLVFLLNEQLYGNKEAMDEIREMIKPLFLDKIFRDESLTSNQVLGIEMIMREWEGMFSFEPGYLDGIPFIISLLNWLRYKQIVDTIDIYKKEDWVEIIKLRGPVETVLLKRCENCNTIHYTMGISGFLDISSHVCSSCGNVYFKSIYTDDSKIPICDCGGVYTTGCPKCGEQLTRSIGEISPYKYFLEHKYIRGEGV